MPNTSRPTTDAGWLAFGANLSTLLIAEPADYGILASDAVGFQTIFNLYAELYARCQEPSVRTTVLVFDKRVALKAMKLAIGKLDQRVRGYSGITGSKLLALGFPPRKQPTRKNPPSQAPKLEIESVKNNVLSILAHAETGSKRAMAAGATGVTIFSATGPTPPPTADGWEWRGNFARARGEVAFDGTVAGKVWLTAVFFNDRGQGPACDPVGVNLAGANDVPSAELAMKLAA